MKTITTFFLLLPFFLSAQYYSQYFDGADTSVWNSIQVDFGTDTNNVWLIGAPQKDIFYAAATLPNALFTDSTYYPDNDTSSFQIHLDSSIQLYSTGIFALHWQQKLDFDTLYDGGKVEFSIDSGLTWHNIINSPYNYNFYGFDSANIDTLHNGEYVFTGTDSTWRNIWLCYDYGWIGENKYIDFRFTSITDGVNNQKEGWIIDNINVQSTIYHTLKTVPQEKYVAVYPNPTKDKLYINVKRADELQLIEHMEIIDVSGKVLKKWKNIPIKFFIETGEFPVGTYFLKVQTNIKSETIQFNISK